MRLQLDTFTDYNYKELYRSLGPDKDFNFFKASNITGIMANFGKHYFSLQQGHLKLTLNSLKSLRLFNKVNISNATHTQILIYSLFLIHHWHHST